MRKSDKILNTLSSASKTITAVKLIGGILISLFLAGFGFHQYVEAQKRDTTEQTIKALSPHLDKIAFEIEKINGKVDKVILTQKFQRQNDTILLNLFTSYKIQNAKNEKEIIQFQKELLQFLPYFLRTEQPDTIKKKIWNEYLSDI